MKALGWIAVLVSWSGFSAHAGESSFVWNPVAPKVAFQCKALRGEVPLTVKLVKQALPKRTFLIIETVSDKTASPIVFTQEVSQDDTSRLDGRLAYSSEGLQLEISSGVAREQGVRGYLRAESSVGASINEELVCRSPLYIL